MSDAVVYGALIISTGAGFCLGMWITIMIGDWINKKR